MGIYLNPDNQDFYMSYNDDIYVDKSMLIEYTNSRLNKASRFICVSRPRRFGKSTDANMLVAYYSRGCDSHELFNALKVSKLPDYEKHLNQHHVIHLNMQEFLSDANSITEMIDIINKEVMNELLKEYDVDVLRPSLKNYLNKIYNDECYKQTAYEKNKDENMDFLPEVRIVTDIEKNVSELMEQYKDSLILYLSNKSRFYNIGVGELYDAYSGMEKYSFGKKYNAVDVLTKEEIRENDALLSFLFTVNIIVDYFTKEFYGEVFRIIRKAGTYFNCEEFSIRKHIDKHLVKDKLDDIVALYNELSTTVDDFLSLCVEKKYIREEFYSAVVEENDYQLVKNVKVQEVKVLADYMSDPKISTQHGVKGESHDTVVFVADNSRSNPVVHMSKFFEMWSNIDITLSEFDAFYYIYSQMLNQIENKIGMKCSQLKADTYISVASIIDEELQAFTKK